MSINVANAAGAYTDAIKRMSQAASGESAAAGKGDGVKSGAESFGQILAQQVSGVEAAARTSEAAATQAAAGQGNLVDLVTQVAEAELMLQTAVTVRDRVISAYQEIMRMPI